MAASYEEEARVDEASSQENGAVRGGERYKSLPVAKLWKESQDDLVVRDGVTGVRHSSDAEELDDLCETVCVELSLPLSFDGPAFAGV